MNTEPTLNKLADPVGDTPGVNTGNDTPGVKETELNRRIIRILAVIAGLGLIALGVWWFTGSQPLPTILLGDQPTSVDLQGLDQPQTLKGSCISSYQVNGIGTDAQGTQRYALSIQLVGDPADDEALGQLMATDDCAGELKLVGETLTERLGLKTAQQELITTSYLSKSGKRLTLP